MGLYLFTDNSQLDQRQLHFDLIFYSVGEKLKL